MSNFDFLNADDSGRPGRPQPFNAGPSRYPIWKWTVHLSESIRIDRTVCLTDTALFVNPEDERPSKPPTDLSRLAYEHSDAVFQRDFDRIPLDAIQRLRFHTKYAWLDVVRVDGSVETIRDFDTRKTEQIFDTLRKRLAPGAPIVDEPVRVEREIFMAIAFFLPVALSAGLLMSASLASAEGRAQMGRSHFGVMMVESLGATTTTLLCVATILAGLAFIAYKVFCPRTVPTVKVR